MFFLTILLSSFPLAADKADSCSSSPSSVGCVRLEKKEISEVDWQIVMLLP